MNIIKIRESFENVKNVLAKNMSEKTHKSVEVHFDLLSNDTNISII